MHKVFVYGTLKKGYGNHRLLEKSKFLGTAYTHSEFSLYNGGFPYATDGGKNEIKGELYEVDDNTLQNLDWLEGYPSHYNRIETQVADEYDGLDKAWIYIATENTKRHINPNRLIRPVSENSDIVEWNRA